MPQTPWSNSSIPLRPIAILGRQHFLEMSVWLRIAALPELDQAAGNYIHLRP